ncbi:hypothetical protein [Halocatena salina]|uniref:Uncharacterized protein n=1 Tax=Halocatena salina TaxID=2934340 RepID=A0A8U0A6H2_9EURY|nr:hypothetical protein [Halocatena salina]UPM44770.1 hypothetical protein MW046_15330 [Halocatena salina]
MVGWHARTSIRALEAAQTVFEHTDRQIEIQGNEIARSDRQLPVDDDISLGEVPSRPATGSVTYPRVVQSVRSHWFCRE